MRPIPVLIHSNFNPGSSNNFVEYKVIFISIIVIIFMSMALYIFYLSRTKTWRMKKTKASIYNLTNKTNEHKKVIFDWSAGYLKNDPEGNVEMVMHSIQYPTTDTQLIWQVKFFHDALDSTWTSIYKAMKTILVYKNVIKASTFRTKPSV